MSEALETKYYLLRLHQFDWTSGEVFYAYLHSTYSFSFIWTSFTSVDTYSFDAITSSYSSGLIFPKC